jgi:hypothetical protein
MNSNEYLYYTVKNSNIKTTNKLQAIESAGGDIKNVELYFCDDEHKKYDWTVEPKQDIHWLIDRRIIALRNEYDHVCLWYSGGFDSHTLLNSFIRTKSKLDEVIIYGKPWIKDPINIEHKFASDYIKVIKEKIYPDLKVTVVNITDKIHQGLYKKFGSDWIFNDCQNSFAYVKASRGLSLQYQPEFINLKYQKGRIDICGTDKPRVDLRDGKWYASMSDNTVMGWFDSECDLFYMCPDATEIYIKQCWNVIKWFETFPQCSHNFVHEVQGQQHHTYYSSWNKAIGRDDVFHEVAMNGLQKKFYRQGTNSLDSIHYLKSNNFNSESDSYKIYSTGLTYLKTKHKDIWSDEKGFPVVMSNPIYIKDFEPSFDTKT